METGNKELDRFLSSVDTEIKRLKEVAKPGGGWTLSDLASDVSGTISDRRDLINVISRYEARIAEFERLGAEVEKKINAHSDLIKKVPEYYAAFLSAMEWVDSNRLFLESLKGKPTSSSSNALSVEDVQAQIREVQNAVAKVEKTLNNAEIQSMISEELKKLSLSESGLSEAQIKTIVFDEVEKIASLQQSIDTSSFATKDELKNLVSRGDLDVFALRSDILDEESVRRLVSELVENSDTQTKSGLTEDQVRAIVGSVVGLTKEEADELYLSRASASDFVSQTDLEGLAKAVDLEGLATKEDLVGLSAGEIDLSSYLTKQEAESFVTSDDLASYATVEALESALGNNTQKGEEMALFEPGKRYFSPVMYTWADGWKDLDGDPNSSSVWNTYARRYQGMMGLITANRASGEWSTDEPDQDFLRDMTTMKDSGVTQLVYVKTNYAAAINPEKYARPGMTTPERFTHDEIVSLVDSAVKHYPGLVDGVFLDEMVSDWEISGQDENDRNVQFEWYKELYTKLKRRFGRNFVVEGNPGSNTTERMLQCADILMTFEDTADKYKELNEKGWLHPNHYRQYPSWRFHHAVIATSEQNIDEVFQIADSHRVGHLFVTDKILIEKNPETGVGSQFEPWQDPYREPPSSTFDLAMIARVKGFGSLIELKSESGDGWVVTKSSRQATLTLQGWNGSQVTLPQGFRPVAETKSLAFSDGAISLVTVGIDGVISINDGSNNVFGSISYIT